MYRRLNIPTVPAMYKVQCSSLGVVLAHGLMGKALGSTIMRGLVAVRHNKPRYTSHEGLPKNLVRVSGGFPGKLNVIDSKYFDCKNTSASSDFSCLTCGV